MQWYKYFLLLLVLVLLLVLLVFLLPWLAIPSAYDMASGCTELHTFRIQITRYIMNLCRKCSKQYIHGKWMLRTLLGECHQFCCTKNPIRAIFNDDFIVSDHFGGVKASSLFDDCAEFGFEMAVKFRVNGMSFHCVYANVSRSLRELMPNDFKWNSS